MSWIRILQPKVIKAIPKGRSPNYATVNKQQIADKIPLFKDAGLAKGEITFAKNPVSETRLYWRSYGSYTSRPVYKRRKKRDLYDKFWDATPSKKNIRVMAQAIKEDTALHGSVFSGRSVTKNKPYASIQLATKLCNMSRDFLEKLWDADAKSKAKRKQRFIEQAIKEETALHGSVFSGKNEPYASRQLATEPLESSTPEEAWIAPLLSRANLLITRDIEWANLTLGFEQANKYAIVDVNNPHEPAGFIREESNVIMRQLLRLRRPFVATITDGYGNELFRVRRPFWWITSSIYAEVGGKEIGVVHRRWHLWRRVYDLYLGDEQFAVVENPGFWNWTFTLKGANGEVLGEIDRDWRGFGFEVLTDAGQYVIRFESAATSGLSEKAGEFEVARPLTLSERAVTVALAVSLDNDYFSRHGGWGLPFFAVAE